MGQRTVGAHAARWARGRGPRARSRGRERRAQRADGVSGARGFRRRGPGKCGRVTHPERHTLEGPTGQARLWCDAAREGPEPGFPKRPRPQGLGGPLLTPSSSATRCHSRWPCWAARAFSWRTSCPLHSCLLTLGCSQFCQNFWICPALRLPSNCAERPAWGASPPAGQRLGTQRGEPPSGGPALAQPEWRSGSSGGAQSLRATAPRGAKMGSPREPPALLAAEVWPEPQGPTRRLQPVSCPTHAHVGDLLPVVAVQPAPQQGLLRELAAGADEAPGQAVLPGCARPTPAPPPAERSLDLLNLPLSLAALLLQGPPLRLARHPAALLLQVVQPAARGRGPGSRRDARAAGPLGWWPHTTQRGGGEHSLGASGVALGGGLAQR